MHNPQYHLFLDQSAWNFGSIPKINFSDQRWQVYDPQNLEYKVVLILILGMEPKNQVIWTTCCKVMAKYISIYFTKSWFPVVSYQLEQKQNILINDMH